MLNRSTGVVQETLKAPPGSVFNLVDCLEQHPRGAAVVLLLALPVLWPVSRLLPAFVVVAWGVLALSVTAFRAGRADLLVAAFIGTAAFYFFLELPRTLALTCIPGGFAVIGPPWSTAASAVYWLLPGAFLGLFVYRNLLVEAVCSSLLLACLPLLHAWDAGALSITAWACKSVPMVAWLTSVYVLGGVFGRILYGAIFPKPVAYAPADVRTGMLVAAAIVVMIFTRQYAPLNSPFV